MGISAVWKLPNERTNGPEQGGGGGGDAASFPRCIVEVHKFASHAARACLHSALTIIAKIMERVPRNREATRAASCVGLHQREDALQLTMILEYAENHNMLKKVREFCFAKDCVQLCCCWVFVQKKSHRGDETL